MSSAAAAAAASAADPAQLATFQKLHPKEFQRKFLQHSVRPDGRALTAVRSTVIAADSISSSPGSSLVKVGNTAVVCATKLEVGKPFDTKPQDGRLSVEVHLGPMCSPKFKSGRATEQAVALSQWLTNAIINSGALRLSDLCIVSGESSWVIYADLLCLNYDGNLYDACLLALVQSLKTLRLPETEVVEEGVGGGQGKGQSIANEVCISGKETRPMPFFHTLVPTTCAMVEGHLLADPTSSEEDLLSSQVTIVLDERSQLCQVHKPGGVPLSDQQIQECIAIAASRVPLLLPLFK